jgi:class 3 adenylate cyclase
VSNAPATAPAAPSAAAAPSSAPRPSPGTGTLTILVTDIVGSTSHSERLGDQRWLEVLRAHNALVREEIAREGGTEVKHSGDGFLATFSSARAAVRTALGVKQAIERHRAQHPDPPIEVRIGLHAGEVEHDSDDVFGVNVSTASRIAGAAEPGEVLVSGVVRDLAESTSDLRFGAAREVALAGRSAPLRVHTVSRVAIAGT